MQLNLFLSYSKASFAGIVETVRNKLLQIILDIKETMPNVGQPSSGAPTNEVKKGLSKNIIQIINNPQGCQFTIGQSNSYSFEEFKGILQATLSNEGISNQQAEQLLDVLDEAKKELPPKQGKKLPQKILDFIKANKSWITETVVDIIKKFWLG